VRALGGVALTLANDVVEESRIARARRKRESVIAEMQRVLNGHEMILVEDPIIGREAAEHLDDGTNDLVVSEMVRTNELQRWFVVSRLSDRQAVP
jgi:starvation-inducible DNA-binding protein